MKFTWQWLRALTQYYVVIVLLYLTTIWKLLKHLFEKELLIGSVVHTFF